MKIRNILVLTSLLILSSQSLLSQEFGPEKIISTDARMILSVHAADLDNDGDKDVLSASYQDDKIAWYENLGLGDFITQHIISDQANEARRVYPADINGDGNIDVVAAYLVGDRIVWYPNNGDRSFGNEVLITDSVNGLKSLMAIDLDNDGDFDVLSASENDDKITWYRNDGNGTFGSQQIISSDADGAYAARAADFDQDGDLDIVSASRADDKIAWYENTGNGNFGSEQIISTSADGTRDCAVGDVDGNGTIDIVYAGFGNNSIAWFSNDGNGNFGSENLVYGDAYGTQSVLLSDFNNDGSQDILCYFNNNIALFTNDGTGGFEEPDYISQESNGFPIFTEDLNGDNNIDIINGYSFSSSMKLIWFPNLFGSLKVEGSSFYDLNENGIWDNEERGLEGIQFDILPNDWQFFSRADGSFSIPILANTSTLTILPDMYWSITTGYSSVDLSVFDTTGTHTLLFGLAPNENINDLTLNIASSLPRCNTEVPFQIVLTNTGTTVLAGTLETANINLINYVEDSANPSPSNIVNGQLSWNFEDLYPGESFTVDLIFLIDGPEAIGDSACLNATATIQTESNEETTYNPPANTDETDLVNICHCTGSGINPYVVLELPYSAVDGQGNYDHANHGCDIIPITDLNNDGTIDELDCLVEQVSYTETTFTGDYCTEIRCSFDPNDKAANPAGIEDEHLTLMGQDIIYTIRFQNTGNDTAFRVELIDTLSEHLDISTFDFITSSHQPVDVSIESISNQEDKVLKFLFEEILLPDSIVDEVGSNGFVQFSIRPKTGLAEPTILTNNAGIYFDLNPPVITNTVEHTLVYTLPEIRTFIIDQLESIDVSISPNPFTNTTRFTLNENLNGNYDVRIFDVSGKFIRSYLDQSQNSLIIQKDGLANGMYILNLYRSGEQNLLGSYKLVVE